MDGWWNTTREFEHFIRVYSQRICKPWVYALRNPLMLEHWDDPKKEKILWEGLKHLWTSRATEMAIRLPIKSCDVLMYCSSDKPSVQPAMHWLARRLGNAGLEVLHWGAATIGWYPGRLPSSTFPVSDMRKILGGALGYQALFDIPFSFWHSAMAYATALVGSRAIARRFERSPRRLFTEIATNRHMTRVLREILAKLQPKCILTNGEQTPVGCALTAAARMEGIRVIWFFNEWPTFQMMPVMSDELWIWNEVVGKTLQGIQTPGLPIPHIEVIGMAQLDCMEQQVRKGDVMAARMPGPQCLVFLSEHIPSYSHHNRVATETALQWLAEAAAQAKDWYFVIKPRFYHDATLLPGERFLKGHKNIVVMRDGVTMSALLAAPEVQAIAALSSSGLLLGVATGRRAFRLLVSDNPYPLPPLDEFVRGISSPEMLVRGLRQQAPASSSTSFPNRGKVLETMETLILQRVNPNHALTETEVLV
ncbi:MAG: hypothetical protein AB7T38_03075 [Nitrospirales bacterium]